MILERLVLENFRQFKGRQELCFSDLQEHNVTVVHADNGFGKTTLLNALLWCLYGQGGLSSDFEKPENLIHEGLAHRCRDANGLAARVELTFTHDEDRYVLSRELTLADQRFDPKRDRISMHAMRDGQSYQLDNPQRRIQAIVPEGIAGFLFFNGERIDHLAMAKNSAEVTNAIHQMLGLKLLRTTIEDLQHQNVRGRFLRELKENTSDEKRDLIAKQESLEADQARFTENLEQAKRNIEALGQEIELIDRSLDANREAHELQARRARLTKEKEELAARRDDVQRRLTRLIAEDGFTLFTEELVERGNRVMQNLREQNMIPAPVIDTFLQELLDSGACICDRHLKPGTPEYEAVRKRLSVAPSQDFNNAVSAVDHALGELAAVSRRTRDQLAALNKERLELNTAIRNHDEEIADIHQKIGGKDNEEVKSLEARRKELEVSRDAERTSVHRWQARLENLVEQVAVVSADIKKIEDQEEAAARAQRRVNAVEDCSRILQQILDAETKELRPILNDEIDGHFQRIIDREYWAELSPDFTLRIKKRIPGSEAGEEVAEVDVALSQGQRQVTSLVFIASLLSLARRRSEIPTIIKGLSGNAYPLVTDSPFGQLAVFRSGLARWIPDLAPQVVLLVSPTQYEGDVAQTLGETRRIGRRYFLAYHGPSVPGRAKPDLMIDGSPVPQYFEHEEEFTEIREL